MYKEFLKYFSLQDLKDEAAIRERKINKYSYDKGLAIIANEFEISPEKILSKSRKAEVVKARKIFQFILRRHCKLTYEEIGRKTNRDHSSVIYSVRKIDEKSQQSPVYHKYIQRLITKIVKA